VTCLARISFRDSGQDAASFGRFHGGEVGRIVIGGSSGDETGVHGGSISGRYSEKVG
jgi:hypothetical protein